MIEFVGYLGAFLLAFSGVPQLIKTYRTKHANDLSIVTLWCTWIGCLSMFVYVLSNGGSTPLILNYLINTTFGCAIIILYFRYKTK